MHGLRGAVLGGTLAVVAAAAAGAGPSRAAVQAPAPATSPTAAATLGGARTLPAADAQTPAATQPPVAARAPDAAAVARGQALYTVNCAACHGADGRGGADAGADLSRSPIATARDDGRQLADFLKVGRPERRMPSFALPDADVAALAAFLGTLAPASPAGAPTSGAPTPGAAAPAGPPRSNEIIAVVVGDAARGEAYFTGAGRCTTCHAATGDLKGIASRLSVAAIQGRMVMPRGRGGYPRSFNLPPDPNDAQRTVTITQPSGEALTGTLLWITDFYVTFVDRAGIRRTVTRQGDAPRVEVTDPLQYHIEHMQRLTDRDMHDLTAYLVTLK